MNLIPVLFVEHNSNYEKFESCDLYTIDRDARSYAGSHSCIAHPPCRLFSRMRRFSKADESEKQLAYMAVEKIRICGGVLEHPAHSILWSEKQLPMPGKGVDAAGGFSISINQHWFGHLAEKNTWLYIKGCDLSQLPLIPLSFDRIDYTISSSKSRKQSGKKEIRKSLRSHTPVALIEFLIEIVQIIELNKRLSHDVYDN